jgi:Icc-related predicted phosphoesterase
MKIHVLSDLHIEFGEFLIPDANADVIVLAGDIGVGLEGLEWLHKQQIHKPIIYVPGNHEFYRHDISLLNDMREHVASNIHILNDGAVEIDGIRFLGCTLWTDFELLGEADKYFAIQHAKENMADFSLIRNNGKAFTPEDSIALHRQSRDWLSFMLGESFDGQTVVVTHHAPSSGSVHPRFANNLLNPAFASKLEDLMDRSRVSLWVHGHMHDAFDYEVYGTRIVCNPCGYVSYESGNGFEPDKVVEII